MIVTVTVTETGTETGPAAQIVITWKVWSLSLGTIKYQNLTKLTTIYVSNKNKPLLKIFCRPNLAGAALQIML